LTTIYFIRHCESDYSVRESRIRPLTEKGLADRRLVTEYLRDKNIYAVLSSPYKRAVDTVSDFAEKYHFTIETDEDFRELDRKGEPATEEEFPRVMKRLWTTDFNVKQPEGECLAEVQERNMRALNEVLLKYKDQNIAIGTHGLALSAIINHYDGSFGYDDFMAMADIMPWVVKMIFDGQTLVSMEKLSLWTKA